MKRNKQQLEQPDRKPIQTKEELIAAILDAHELSQISAGNEVPIDARRCEWCYADSSSV